MPISDVTIREMRHSDVRDVTNLLRAATWGHLPGTLRLAAHAPWLRNVLVVMVVISATVWRDPVIALLAGITVLALLVVSHVCAALFYMYGPPLADMKMQNVMTEYFSSENSSFWVAVAGCSEDEEIVGTIAIVPHSSGCTGRVAWLRRMAVKATWRRRGVARDLLRHAVTFCCRRDYERIDLVTTEAHAAARRLYEREGFELVSYRPHMYYGGLVRIWMYEYCFKL